MARNQVIPDVSRSAKTGIRPDGGPQSPYPAVPTGGSNSLWYLEEREERLQALYELAPIGHLTLDSTGAIRESNQAAEVLLGLRRRELVGRPLSAFVRPEHRQSLQTFLGTVRTGLGRIQCELELLRMNGAHSRVRVESIPICMTLTAPGCCHLALIDITQVALDQAQLRALNRDLAHAVSERTTALSESLARQQAYDERLGLALEASRMGTWTVDIASRQCTCDERHGRLYGREAVPFVHSMDDWLAYVHPEDLGRVSMVIDRALRGLDTWLSVEYRVVWADGSVHWLLARGRVYMNDQGKPVSIAGVEQDIDDRKTLEMEVLHIADREQRRIGQELHDDIQQRLTGLGLIAENLCEQFAGMPTSEQAISRRLARGISDLSERVHRLSHGLVPLDLNGEGLCVALSRLASETDAPGLLRCSFRSEEGLEVHDGFAATHLYRIAQEAVTNAIRHSAASHIRIGLSRIDGLTVLTVADNGSGIKDHDDSGRGMRIMAYRASLIGATLKVSRTRTRGTRLSCALNLPSRADRKERLRTREQ